MLLVMMIEPEIVIPFDVSRHHLIPSLSPSSKQLSSLFKSHHRLSMSNNIDCSASFATILSILNHKIAHSTNQSWVFQPRKRSRSLAGFPCRSPRFRSLPAMRVVSKHFGEVLRSAAVMRPCNSRKHAHSHH